MQCVTLHTRNPSPFVCDLNTNTLDPIQTTLQAYRTQNQSSALPSRRLWIIKQFNVMHSSGDVIGSTRHSHIYKHHTYSRSRRISLEQTKWKRPILVFISFGPLATRKTNQTSTLRPEKSWLHENAGSLYGHFPRVACSLGHALTGIGRVLWLCELRYAHLRLSPLHWPASPAESLLFYAPALRQHGHIYLKIEILSKPTQNCHKTVTLHYKRLYTQLWTVLVVWFNDHSTQHLLKLPSRRSQSDWWMNVEWWWWFAFVWRRSASLNLTFL